MKSRLLSQCNQVIQSINRQRGWNTFKASHSRYLSDSSPSEQVEGDEHKHVTTIDNDPVDIHITHTSKTSKKSPSLSSIAASAYHHLPLNVEDDTALVDSLLHHTSTLIEKNGSNLIAFSGGVDSSLAAALVNQVKNNNSQFDGTVVKAVIGVSSSLPKRQLDLARSIASAIDMELIETSTTEGNDKTYIANDGQACFVCKNTLYAALEAVASTAIEISQRQDSTTKGTRTACSNNIETKVALFNGTNADDTKDPTRLGLLSAKSFSVKSPLMHITKDQVRRAARHLNLLNWNYAASPCLRSRLALGVEATEHHLKAVNSAEERVRKVLSLDESVNLRVRMLAGKRAMVELDQHFIDSIIQQKEIDGENLEFMLRQEGFEEFCGDLGFTGGIGVRSFKTGSVSLKK